MRFTTVKTVIAVLFFLNLASLQVSANSEDLETCGVSLSLLTKAGLRPHWAEVAGKLLDAQHSGNGVRIREPGLMGETKGLVSNIRVEDGDLKFDINGKIYSPFYQIDVHTMSTHRTRESVLANLSSADDKAAAENLFQAEETHSAVAVSEPGMMGEQKGVVSNIRLEDGQLRFQLDGKPYEPFYGISVKILPTHTTKESILENVSPHQRTMVETLLDAQAAHSTVEIVERFGGGIRGQVSSVRVEDGRLKFKVGDHSYEPFYEVEVKVLETVTSPEAILAKIHPSKKAEVEILLKAMSENRQVRIIEGGVMGSREGLVSNVRLVDGDLEFDINGKTYKPFYGLSVTILTPVVEGEMILPIDSKEADLLKEQIMGLGRVVDSDQIKDIAEFSAINKGKTVQGVAITSYASSTQFKGKFIAITAPKLPQGVMLSPAAYMDRIISIEVNGKVVELKAQMGSFIVVE